MPIESRQADKFQGSSDVARYYDSNTRRFLAFGGGARSRSIHRALWGPGVGDSEMAANYVNVLIGDAVESLALAPDATLLDLGCGVGGTLFALARRYPGLRLHGITVSSRQAELARLYADRSGLGAQCRVHCGDFETMELGIRADVAVAVESAVHAHSLPALLASVFRHLGAGGTLIIVDDFIAVAGSPGGRALNTLEDFRAGWRLSSLVTVAAFVAAADSAGFTLKDSRELSSMIRLRRPRDRVIGVLGPWLRPLINVPLFGNLVGGAALTRGLRAGTLGYYWLRLQR